MNGIEGKGQGMGSVRESSCRRSISNTMEDQEVRDGVHCVGMAERGRSVSRAPERVVSAKGEKPFAVGYQL